MSIVDGQLSTFRGGRGAGFNGDRMRDLKRVPPATATYTVVAQAYTGPVAMGLTVVGTDPIGSLSGGVTWTPNDPTARYLIKLNVQTSAAGVGQFAIVANNSIVVSGQTPASSHMEISTDGIDFGTALTCAFQCINSATVAATTTNCNLVQITKLANF